MGILQITGMPFSAPKPFINLITRICCHVFPGLYALVAYNIQVPASIQINVCLYTYLTVYTRSQIYHWQVTFPSRQNHLHVKRLNLVCGKARSAIPTFMYCRIIKRFKGLADSVYLPAGFVGRFVPSNLSCRKLQRHLLLAQQYEKYSHTFFPRQTSIKNGLITLKGSGLNGNLFAGS